MSLGDVKVQLCLHDKYSEEVLKFTYIDHKLLSISPKKGGVNGGELITITGEGLLLNSAFEMNHILIDSSRKISRSNIVENTFSKISFHIPETTQPSVCSIDIIINGIKSFNSISYCYTTLVTSISQKSINVNTKTLITIFGNGFNENSTIHLLNLKNIAEALTKERVKDQTKQENIKDVKLRP